MFVETQMRSALVRAAVKAANAGNTAQRSVISRIGSSADIGIGVRKVKDWNAHLSLHTYSRLKTMGVMA